MLREAGYAVTMRLVCADDALMVAQELAQSAFAGVAVSWGRWPLWKALQGKVLMQGFRFRQWY